MLFCQFLLVNKMFFYYINITNLATYADENDGTNMANKDCVSIILDFLWHSQCIGTQKKFLDKVLITN